MKNIRLLLVGFGNVGKAFIELIWRKQNELKSDLGIDLHITGIATGSHGNALDSEGIPIPRLLNVIHSGGSYSLLSKGAAPHSTLELINSCQADVLLENTPVNHHTGQPAIDHIKAGLERGMHAITANKGPVVHGYSLLSKLAAQKGLSFRFESSVMDGAPIFSLHEACLPVNQLLGFFGILNSCTNLLLNRMENGEAFEDAVKYAQSIGIAETDPSADVDGWDSAIKVAALCTVLMHTPLKPQDVIREGIRSITPESIAHARSQNKRWKLVCSVNKDDNGTITAKVQPELIGSDSPLYSVNGTSSYVQFKLDSLPGLGILESNPGPETTAYGLLADLIHIVKKEISV